MKVNSYEKVEEKAVDMPGASGCTVRRLVSESDGAPNFAMRRFEIAPGGYTPRHSPPYEPAVYVLEGDGLV
ncbi:MAG: cupin, partial [Planctomycetes bacterium]|nr:cupin [Planctomycetota bacterium]